MPRFFACLENLLETFDDAVRVLSNFGAVSTGLIVDPLSDVATLNSLLFLLEKGSGSGGCALRLSGVSGRLFSELVNVRVDSCCAGLSLWRCKTFENIDLFSAGAVDDFLSCSWLRCPGVGLEPRRPRALVELIGVILRGVPDAFEALWRDGSLLVVGL